MQLSMAALHLIYISELYFCQLQQYGFKAHLPSWLPM